MLLKASVKSSASMRRSIFMIASDRLRELENASYRRAPRGAVAGGKYFVEGLVHARALIEEVADDALRASYTFGLVGEEPEAEEA